MKRTDRQPVNLTPEMFDLYDSYAHDLMSRRDFISSLGKLCGAAAVGSALSALMPNYAVAEQVSFNDPDIKASFELFSAPLGHGGGKGYLVRPTKADHPMPVVLVIHENRGLNPYIKDVARRLAKSGFIAFAPDALHPLGGYPGNDDDGRAMQRSLDRAKIVQDLLAAGRFAKRLDGGNGKLGVTGFCFGGSMTNRLAAELPNVVDAAAPYYGGPAPRELVADIKAPIQLHFAENDKRVNAAWPDYQKALETNGKYYQAHEYPGTMHGFHNDSTARFSPDAAQLAWQRTLRFFREHLG